MKLTKKRQARAARVGTTPSGGRGGGSAGAGDHEEDDLKVQAEGTEKAEHPEISSDDEGSHSSGFLTQRGQLQQQQQRKRARYIVSKAITESTAPATVEEATAAAVPARQVARVNKDAGKHE